jgi:signal transduction histidine kinase
MLEDALRAHLNRRCRRAYAHDLRNGLQGIFGGVDALTRAARTTKPLAVPLEQLTQFVQQAITNHERGLERVLDSLAPEQQEPTVVCLRELLTEQVRFMTNDTARNNVRVRQSYDDDMKVSVVFARLRLVALGLLTDSIDAMPSGGELRVAGRTVEGHAQFEIIDTRKQAQPASFVNQAIDRLVLELSGHIEYKQNDSGGCEVRVQLPAA